MNTKTTTQDNVLEIEITSAYHKDITTKDFKAMRIADIKGIVGVKEVITTIFLHTAKQRELYGMVKEQLKAGATSVSARINVYASETTYTSATGEEVAYKLPRLKASFVAIK